MKKNIKDINLKTEISLLNQKDSFERNGGIAACIKYENNFFFKDINLKGKNLIEFGCGIFPSSFGIEKNKMPKKYIASDTSKKILKIAKINDDRLVYKLIDLEKKIKQSIKYDVIVLKGVLHHTKNPEDILIKLKRILKPNGIILISEPNLSSFVGNFLKWLLSLLFNKNMEDSPYGQYNFEKISNSIKDANLMIYKKWYSTFLLLILTGDYGRIKIFPDNRLLFSFFIFIENLLFYFLNFFFLTKFINFKINLMLRK